MSEKIEGLRTELSNHHFEVYEIRKNLLYCACAKIVPEAYDCHCLIYLFHFVTSKISSIIIGSSQSISPSSTPKRLVGRLMYSPTI